MHILVAGGAGFIGSHLADRFLAAGHDLFIVDNLLTGRPENIRRIRRRYPPRRIGWQGGDICSLRVSADHLDAVIHLASPASPRDYLEHPLETLDAGSLGTRNLLEIARRSGARFLLASTSEVYGDPLIHPQVESYWGNVNPVGPRSVYDEAKRFSEALCAAYGREHALRVRIARIFNTYGPRMREHDGRIIPTFIGQALRGEPLTVQGDGSQTRSYCFVADLVAGLERLLWSDAEGPVNLGNPDEHSVLDTARIIRSLVGSSSPIIHVPLPQDDPRLRKPDITRARALLDWQPATGLEDGLRQTIGDLRLRSQRVSVARQSSGLEPDSSGSLGRAAS